MNNNKLHNTETVVVNGIITSATSLYNGVPAQYRGMYSTGTLANKDLFLQGIKGLTAKDCVEIANKIYKLNKYNTHLYIRTKNRGVTEVNSNYLGYYMTIVGIKRIKLDVNCEYDVFKAKVLSVKSLIRQYQTIDGTRPYKWNGDYKVPSGFEDCDGVDRFQYINTIDREIYIDLYGKVKSEHLKLMKKYNLHYMINGNTINPFTRSKAEPTVFEAAYMKVFAVDEVDEDLYFINSIRDDMSQDNILNTFAGVYRYESFRDDMHLLGFNDNEINIIGKVLMMNFRFVDQIEVGYEEQMSDEESEE